MQHANKVQVSNTAIQHLCDVRTNDCTVRACVDRIREGVFCHGMTIADQKLLRKYTAAGHAAYEWLMCVGVIPVCIVHDELLGQVVPEVPAMGTLQLYVGVGAAGREQYSAEFLWRGELPERPKIRIWAESCEGPDIRGTIRTKVMGASHERWFESYMMQRTMVAEQIRTNPPLVTEDRRQNGGFECGNLNATDDAIAAAEENRLRLVETNRQNHARLHAKNAADCDDPFASMCQVSEYFAPAERSVVAQRDVPSNFPALVPLKQLTNDVIFELFGLSANGASRKRDISGGATHTDAGSLNKHVQLVTGSIQQFLNHAFQLCKALKGSKRLLEGDDEPQIQGDVDAIRLLNVPEIDGDSVTAFRDAGYITQAEARALIRGSLGFK